MPRRATDAAIDIRTNAEFLRENPDAATVDRSAAIADIVAETERMGRLVDGLLVLARADAGIRDRSPTLDLESGGRRRGAARSPGWAVARGGADDSRDGRWICARVG